MIQQAWQVVTKCQFGMSLKAHPWNYENNSPCSLLLIKRGWGESLKCNFTDEVLMPHKSPSKPSSLERISSPCRLQQLVPYCTGPANNQVHRKATSSKAVSSTGARSKKIPPDSTKKVWDLEARLPAQTRVQRVYAAVLVLKVKSLL